MKKDICKKYNTNKIAPTTTTMAVSSLYYGSGSINETSTSPHQTKLMDGHSATLRHSNLR